ncbi:hypothetical protein HUW63_14555 [Myxococcus sp. AM001]|nr:hypothetical protein [Myxococcus sp. AM001]
MLRFGQVGAPEFGGGARIDESERWRVRCEQGRIDIVTPAVQVSLRVGASELKLDPRFSRLLRPGSREFGGPAVQSLEEVFAALASGMGLDTEGGPFREGDWQVSGLREALSRAQLLNVERLLASGNLDRARSALQSLPPGPALPELSSWTSALNLRLEALRSKPPLMPTGVRRVGTIMSLPGLLHEDDNPILFWRRAQLCVRQEASAPPRMRCIDARTGRWEKEEPYQSPYGEGSGVRFEYQGAIGYYKTKVVTQRSETDHGNWYEPVVVARGKGDQLVVVSAQDPRQHSELQGLDLSSGPGSLLAGRNRYYFSKPDELRSLKVEGQAWRFVVPGPHGEVHCAAHPRVSPNGRWAACPARQKGGAPTSDAGTSSRFDLFLFELAPRAP